MSKDRDPTWFPRAARAVLSATTSDFGELVRLSSLNPKQHLSYADWSGISFRQSDLRGFDFTGARLIGCDFNGSRIEGARFDRAELASARHPHTLRPVTPLAAAKDWEQHRRNWRRSAVTEPDDHLPVGAVFQDAPFAPQMVVVPPLPAAENDAASLPFAVSICCVTNDMWRTAAHDEGLGSRADPTPEATHAPMHIVGGEDVRWFLDWLSRRTGKAYRLLTKAEWLHCDRSPVTKTLLVKPDPQWAVAFAPVGTGAPNAFGLFDTGHNASEWCINPQTGNPAFIVPDILYDRPKPPIGHYTHYAFLRVARSLSLD